MFKKESLITRNIHSRNNSKPETIPHAATCAWKRKKKIRRLFFLVNIFINAHMGFKDYNAKKSPVSRLHKKYISLVHYTCNLNGRASKGIQRYDIMLTSSWHHPHHIVTSSPQSSSPSHHHHRKMQSHLELTSSYSLLFASFEAFALIIPKDCWDLGLNTKS